MACGFLIFFLPYGDESLRLTERTIRPSRMAWSVKVGEGKERDPKRPKVYLI